MPRAVSFDEFMKDIDKRLDKLVGLDHRSLADAPYHDNFDGELITDEAWEDFAYEILVEYNDMPEATFEELWDSRA